LEYNDELWKFRYATKQRSCSGIAGEGAAELQGNSRGMVNCAARLKETSDDYDPPLAAVSMFGVL
jgi:hypothetical protein